MALDIELLGENITVGDIKIISDNILRRYKKTIPLMKVIHCKDHDAREQINDAFTPDEFAKISDQMIRDIGKIICEDNDIEWGTAETEAINNDTPLSERATNKLKEFVKLADERLGSN